MHLVLSALGHPVGVVLHPPEALQIARPQAGQVQRVLLRDHLVLRPLGTAGAQLDAPDGMHAPVAGGYAAMPAPRRLDLRALGSVIVPADHWQRQGASSSLSVSLLTSASRSAD